MIKYTKLDSIVNALFYIDHHAEILEFLSKKSRDDFASPDRMTDALARHLSKRHRIEVEMPKNKSLCKLKNCQEKRFAVSDTWLSQYCQKHHDEKQLRKMMRE